MTDPATLAERPAWWLCTKSSDNRFTPGVAYEVQEYDRAGRATIVTDIKRTRATLPIKGAFFVPHDPWAKHRARSQGGTDNG